MIPGTCPDCGSIRPLPDFLRDAETRAALATELRAVIAALWRSAKRAGRTPGSAA